MIMSFPFRHGQLALSKKSEMIMAGMGVAQKKVRPTSLLEDAGR